MSGQLIFALLAAALGPAVLVYLALAGPDASRQRTLANLGRGMTAVRKQAPISGRTRPSASLPRLLSTPASRGLIESLLVRAGRPVGWSVDRILATKLLLGGVIGALMLLYALTARSILSLIVAVAATVLAYFAPELRLYSIGLERREKISLELADTLDQMSIAVEAGLGFDAAMVRVARNGKGILAAELIRTLQDIQVGKPRRDAYADLAERTDVDDLRRFTRSIIQAETYGLALGEVLHTQAAEMRLKRRQRAEEKAMQIPVKVIFPLILCILPVLFIVILGPAIISISSAFLK